MKNPKRDDKEEEVKNIVVSTLAEFLGVDEKDIEVEDYFEEDLHMKPTDFAELLENLENKGVDVSNLDLSQLETVNDLISAIYLSQPL